MNSPHGQSPSPNGGPPQGPELPPDLPEPVVAPRGGWLPSLVWLVPLVAALIGIALVAKSVLDRGPTITISFTTAEGLEPGKTKVKYKDVDIGSVKTIRLSRDHSRVLVSVQLTKEAEDFAVEDTRFWIVRPRIGTTGITGLGTLLSGSYIGVDAGRSHESQSDFVGLEKPPAVTGDQKGRRFSLHGASLGSIDIGSPVYYRRVQVGQVVGFSLDRDGTGVSIDVFIDSPYDQYVGLNSRWWHASGVDLRLDSNGLKLNTQSLATVVIGGLAFQSPPGERAGKEAPDDTVFTLAANEGDAMRAPDGPPLTVVMNFNQSLRGLSVGATVDFRGIELGEVTAIGVHYDPKARDFTMPVTMNLYPDRLGQKFRESVERGGEAAGKELLRTLVAHGLRGQLRTGNLLTNQLYVALDLFPKAKPVSIDVNREPFELPTVPNALEELQVQVADIARKLDQIPFDELSKNLNGTLQSANSLFKQLDTQLAPQARETLAAAQRTFGAAQSTLQQDSPLQSDMHQALTQLTQTLQTLNALADYLERHPESLLRGKNKDPKQP
ncbi:MlaD family protein [Trinickia sp. Y13]|uniref:PqiB family protein n=1 Tax=Trinickia sp. Y13 TaxID=2917807 RepID=UPI002404FE9B|nr:MlaD family protein [Trinickia sp. Y13]MDG0025215.1 MlaD family protein [Trinickia sp. Y13]